MAFDRSDHVSRPAGKQDVRARQGGKADAILLAREILNAAPRCPHCGNEHYVAEMDWHRGQLILIGMNCSGCNVSILPTYLNLPTSRARRCGEGWI